MLRRQAVLDRHRDAADRLDDMLQVVVIHRQIAEHHPATVNPEDHWKIRRPFRRVDVHFLPWVAWLGVGDVPLHVEFRRSGGGRLGLRLRQCERRKEEHGEEEDELLHSGLNFNLTVAPSRVVYQG